MSDVMSFSAWMLPSLANGLQPLMVSAICGGGVGVVIKQGMIPAHCIHALSRSLLETFNYMMSQHFLLVHHGRYSILEAFPGNIHLFASTIALPPPIFYSLLFRTVYARTPQILDPHHALVPLIGGYEGQVLCPRPVPIVKCLRTRFFFFVSCDKSSCVACCCV